MRAARTSGMRHSSRSTAARSTRWRVPPRVVPPGAGISPTAGEGEELGRGAAAGGHGLEVDADGGLAELIAGGDRTGDERAVPGDELHEGCRRAAGGGVPRRGGHERESAVGLLDVTADDLVEGGSDADHGGLERRRVAV